MRGLLLGDEAGFFFSQPLQVHAGGCGDLYQSRVSIGIYHLPPGSLLIRALDRGWNDIAKFDCMFSMGHSFVSGLYGLNNYAYSSKSGL
jgi:hypothetical protein